MKKAILTALLFSFFTMPLHAQFLKKLKKKVENRVENTIINKTADKAASETEKSMENLMNMQLKNNGFPKGMEQVQVADIPEVYDFEWSYVMEIQTGQGDMKMKYFLKKDAPYFGFQLPENEFYMVMDPVNEINVMYMDSGGNKMLTATTMPQDSSINNEETGEHTENYDFKEIGKETIMGFECTGYQAEDDQRVFTFYITTEPDISFNNIYSSGQSNLPEGFDAGWLEDGKGLMMKMIMEGKKNAKENVTMTCISLEKKPFSLHKSDYSSLAGN